jgi:hypothetical protein
MSFVRFATAKALFEAFPEVSQKLRVAATDQPPIDFVRALSLTGKLPEAVTFCAYLLPRREAVWWACRRVRELFVGIAHDRADGLLVAEAWVYQPDDHHRLQALEIGAKGDRNQPTTWLALAAGWAGGTQVSGAQQVPTPPYMTARATRVAVLLGASRLGRAERMPWLQSCIGEAIKLAETGLG